MTRPFLLRAAAVSLLTLGFTTLGVQAAFADDSLPAESSAASTPAAATTDPYEAAAPQESAPVAAAPAPADVSSEPALPETSSGAAGPQVAVSSQETSTEESGTEATGTDVGSPTPAADPYEAVDPTPFKLVAWSLPCGVQNPFCAPGQTLAHVVDLAEPNLDALDEELAGTCGDFQVDLYYDSATTAALIDAGVLIAANNPTEDLAYGALPYGTPYKLVDNEDCAVGGSVVPLASATPQTCNVDSALVNGEIQVAIMPGVTYTITGPNGAVTFDPTTGTTGRVAPGAYAVTYALEPTFTSTVPNPIPVSVAAFAGTCAVTPPTTTPPTTTPPTTTTPGDPSTAVLGDPTQLETLALTGSDPLGLAATASGFLLVGIAMLTVLRVLNRRSAGTGQRA